MNRTTRRFAPRRRALRPVRPRRRALARLVAVYILVVGCLFAGLRLADGALAAQQDERPAAQTAGQEAEARKTGYDGPSSAGDWNLLLVNRDNPLPEGYEVTTAPLAGGQAVEERCLADLQAMMDDCRAAGLEPVICSSYRTQDKQQELFDEQVRILESRGLSEGEARAKAGTSVALPGTSEHQLGLAADIVDARNQLLDSSQESMPVQQWLMANSWSYGFVLRYPSDKSDVTGIIYEPWHYRYVGKPAAREMHEAGLCLEEYRALVSGS